MNHFRFHKLTLIVVVGVSFLFLVCRTKQDKLPLKPSVLEVEQINLIQLVEKLKTTNYKLKVVNVWASWCVSCREEHPVFIKPRRPVIFFTEAQ